MKLPSLITGDAKELTEHIPLSDIMKDDGSGVKNTFEILDARYSERKRDILASALENLFMFSRSGRTSSTRSSSPGMRPRDARSTRQRYRYLKKYLEFCS